MDPEALPSYQLISDRHPASSLEDWLERHMRIKIVPQPEHQYCKN